MRAAEFNQLLGGSDVLRDSFDRARIARRGSYIEFVARLYRDLDRIIFSMQTDRHLRQLDSEDRLTVDVLMGLKPLGYRVTHDAQKGGHIDLDVEFGPYTWIGEAKKDGKFSQGFQQLTTRYVPSSGNYSHNHGGLIFYLVRGKDALAAMAKWNAELTKLGALRTVTCGGNPLAMYSEHKLVGPGTNYTIRSMFVSLYHRPKDPSGLKTAARRRRVSRAVRSRRNS